MLNSLLVEGDFSGFGYVEVAVLLIVAGLSAWLLIGTAGWPRMRKIVGVALVLAGIVFVARRALL